MLFSEIERSGTRSKHYAEPSYSYLDGSGREEAARVRTNVDAWFEHYPEEHRARFVRRFCSADETSFHSAFFELYLHELGRRLGYRAEVLDSDESDVRHPDFEMVGPNDSFYLEATVVTEASLYPTSVMRVKDQFIDELNRRVASPNFFLHLHESGAPKSAPSAKRVARELEAWVKGLDPDDAIRVHREQGFGALPSYRVVHDGWRMLFVAQSWRPESRGKEGLSVVGGRSFGSGPIDRVRAIRESAKKKANRYGDLGKPYVVGVNVCSEFTIDETELDDALFSGTEVGAAGDSAWLGPTGPQNRGLSAVLTLWSLNPWTVAARVPVLYENPWGRSPYRGTLRRLPRREVGPHSLLETTPGEHPRDLFELAPEWPGA